MKLCPKIHVTLLLNKITSGKVSVSSHLPLKPEPFISIVQRHRQVVELLRCLPSVQFLETGLLTDTSAFGSLLITEDYAIRLLLDDGFAFVIFQTT